MERTLPIIRLEVEGMKRAICTALTQHSAQMDADLKAAVDDYCTPENLAHVVKSTAAKILDSVIREEVEKFFRFSGEGRKAVAQAVKECILNRETYGPLDEG
jgi:hypothetical protein